MLHLRMSFLSLSCAHIDTNNFFWMEAAKDLLLRTKFMELKSKVLAKLNEERYAIVMKWESQSE